jgi:membrane-bound lytic murein transglycosylase B
MLIALQGENAVEYRVGFANFYAITRYNRSAMYASVVAELADAVQQPAPPPAPSASPESEHPPAPPSRQGTSAVPAAP